VIRCAITGRLTAPGQAIPFAAEQAALYAGETCLGRWRVGSFAGDRGSLLAQLRMQLQASRGHALPSALRRAIDIMLGGGHGLERR